MAGNEPAAAAVGMGAVMRGKRGGIKAGTAVGLCVRRVRRMAGQLSGHAGGFRSRNARTP